VRVIDSLNEEEVLVEGLGSKELHYLIQIDYKNTTKFYLTVNRGCRLPISLSFSS